MNTNENTLHSIESSNQQAPLSNHTRRSVPDIPSIATTTIRPSTAHPSERTVNELRINLSSPSSLQQQTKVLHQFNDKIPQQHITKLIFK
jgi:hypothetical protein